MTLRKITGFTAAAAIALFTAACASSGQTAATEDTAPAEAASGVTVRVDNNRVGGTTIVVFIEPEAGVRRQLGEVEPGATGSFNYQGQPGTFRLVAQGVGGGDMRSENFRIFANTSTVTWNMSANYVTVATRR